MNTATINLRVRLRFAKPGVWLAQVADAVWPGWGGPVLVWWMNHVARTEYRDEQSSRWRRADRDGQWELR